VIDIAMDAEAANRPDRLSASVAAERIRAALAGGMSVRKTAAKFDVNPSTVQRVARPFDGAENASAVGAAMGAILRNHIAKSASMSVAFSRARTPPICRCSSSPRSN